MDNEVQARIRRIYAALGSVIEPGVSEVPVSMGRIGNVQFLEVDFRDGLSDEELLNRVHSLIHNVANLEGHLIRWARARELDSKVVADTVKQSVDLRIVIDLSNNDKHGYPPRNGGRSGLSPKLTDIERWLRMTTQPQVGSSVGFTIGPDGVGRVVGDGFGELVITGDVVDEQGNKVGDLDAIVQRAIEAWEALLEQHAA